MRLAFVFEIEYETNNGVVIPKQFSKEKTRPDFGD